jgi:hypothetical protein
LRPALIARDTRQPHEPQIGQRETNPDLAKDCEYRVVWVGMMQPMLNRREAMQHKAMNKIFSKRPSGHTTDVHSTGATIVPDSADWLREFKYDGYRLRLERDGDRVRLITRGGTIGPGDTRGLSRRRAGSGRGGLCSTVKPSPGVDGIPDFNALHSGKHNDEVQLCALVRFPT